jgi:hypothetical protein
MCFGVLPPPKKKKNPPQKKKKKKKRAGGVAECVYPEFKPKFSFLPSLGESESAF